MNPTTCSMQVHQLQLPIPQLQISTCSTTIILLLATKDLGGRGRPQEKGFHAVNSKQKLTKNLFLVYSSLTCWLAGPFCWNLPLSTKDLDDEAQCRRFWSLHVPQLSFFLLSTKSLWGLGKSHNLFNASPSTASLTNEIPPPEQWIPQFVQCKTINYNCKSHNCKSLHAPELSFFIYQPKIWEVGVGQRRRGFMLSIQSKNWLKTYL